MLSDDDSEWWDPRRRVRKGVGPIEAILADAYERLDADHLENPLEESRPRALRSEQRLKVHALIANLCHAAVTNVSALRLHMDPRYYDRRPDRQPLVETGTLPALVLAMEAAGIIRRIVDTSHRVVSRVMAGSWLHERFANVVLTLDDTWIDPSVQPVLHLKGAKPARKWQGNGDPETRRSLLPLPGRLHAQALEVQQLEDQVRVLNKHQAALGLSVWRGDGAGIRVWDPENRYFYRSFVDCEAGDGRFRLNRGGRFQGPFWLYMPRSERWRLALDGRRLCQLDVQSMFLKLLYVVAGQPMPDHDDPYQEIADETGLSRAAIKKLISAMTFDRHDRRQFPKLDADEAPDFFGSPRKTSCRAAIAAIKGAHPNVSQLFGSGIGYELFFHESEILRAAILRCAEEGIPALYLYDAYLVPWDYWERAGDILAGEFKRYTGRIVGGLASSPRIRATRSVSPYDLAKFKFQQIQYPNFDPDEVWVRVREPNGQWKDKSSTPELWRDLRFLGVKPREAPKRAFLKGERMTLFNNLIALVDRESQPLPKSGMVGPLVNTIRDIKKAVAQNPVLFCAPSKARKQRLTRSDREEEAALCQTINALPLGLVRGMLAEIGPGEGP